MKRKFVAIGHIVNDTEPSDHLGGGVSYSSIAAARLGYEAHIITKCPPQHPYIAQLKKLGVTVHVLPSEKNTITTFKNTYDAQGKRTQQVLEQQERITIDDLPSFPHEILQNATILVAVVVSEVDTALYPLLAKEGILSVTPQGYFRDIDMQGRVQQKVWSGFEKDIVHATNIVFSEEDITIDGSIDLALLKTFKKLVSITVMTQGENGSTVYNKGEKVHVTSLHLHNKEIVDFTGAGDTYAAAFITTAGVFSDLKQVAATASFFASLKVMGLGGFGIDSIPNREQRAQFIAQNNVRYEEFLRENNLTGETLFT